MPRPTDLTPELGARIIRLVLDGSPPLTAARACGVAESTWYGWLQRGRGEQERPLPAGPNDALYSEFAEALADAEHAMEAALVTKAIRVAQRTEQVLMVLERHPRTRDRWRPPARTVEQATTISGPDGGPVRVEVATPETEQELRDRLDSLIEFMVGIDGSEPAGPAPDDDRGAATGSPRPARPEAAS